MVAPIPRDDAVDNSKASYEAPAPCTSQVIQVPCSDWARQEGDVGCTPVHSDDGTVDTKTPSGEVQSPEVLTQPAVNGSTGELAYNHSAFCKVYGPGPGAYTPSTDRRGAWDAQSYSFGNARQRPQHVCIHDRVASPGPVYLPRTDSLSWSTSPPRYRFGRRHVGSRFETQHDHQPSNAPHWNPGPGDYHAQMLHRSKSQHLGADAPRTVFSHAPKLNMPVLLAPSQVCPSLNLSATVFVSSSHAQLENAGVFSPGPAFYSPQNSLVKSAAPQHTMSAKFPTYFDLCLDPTRQLSPGPGVHDPRARDKRGTKVWGSDPRATFGKAPREWDPELRLSAAPFISHKHAQHANHGVHSPGPAQQAGREPRKAYGHVTTPLLASGPRDRFFTRFEEGRVA
ncbi:hypothetical protein QJQ45_026920 [Haematococcus lacustris]|nr:hypothetical protein QJQ45_026920 [Haematococcus lacustris]